MVLGMMGGGYGRSHDQQVLFSQTVGCPKR
jgi:hypothetical protein